MKESLVIITDRLCGSLYPGICCYQVYNVRGLDINCKDGIHSDDPTHSTIP